MTGIPQEPRPSGSSPQTQSSNCSKEEARKYAAILLNCYRKDDVTDPEIFVRTVVLVLSDYPESIVRAVCHPSRGLPARQNFLPSVFEIRQACEAIAQSEAVKAKREQGGKVDLMRARAERRSSSLPKILPYMAGQPDNPRSDPRAGKTEAQLRSEGYQECHISPEVQFEHKPLVDDAPF